MFSQWRPAWCRRSRKQHSNMNRCGGWWTASPGERKTITFDGTICYLYSLLSCSGSRWWSFIAHIKLLSIIQTEWESLKWPFAIFILLFPLLGGHSFVLWTHAASIAHVFDIKILFVRHSLHAFAFFIPFYIVWKMFTSKIRFQTRTKPIWRANGNMRCVVGIQFIYSTHVSTKGIMYDITISKDLHNSIRFTWLIIILIVMRANS